MQRTLWRLLPAAFALGVVGGVWPGPGPAAGQSLAQRTERIILSLGNDQFIPKAAIEATTDARFQSDLRGLRFLDEVSVIVLADLPYDRLPAPLQANLAAWVKLLFPPVTRRLPPSSTHAARLAWRGAGSLS